MSKLDLSSNNQFNGMEREEFLKLLDSMGLKHQDGHGQIIYEYEVDNIPIYKGITSFFGLSKDKVSKYDVCTPEVA